jgi:iron complex transport system ATP-binding protein
MLARAFVQQPQLLLLDVPTSNLDPKNQYEMLALVRRMTQERNISALIVIHDLNLALRYCDKFVFIKDGVVYRYGDASIITVKRFLMFMELRLSLPRQTGKK